MKIIMKNLSAGFARIKTPTILLAVLAFALLFVWQRAYTMSLSRKITRLENRLLELKADNSKKLIQIANLSSPERLEELAKQMCGLRYSTPQERVCVVLQKNTEQTPQSKWKRSIFTIRDYFKQKWERFVAAPSGKRWGLHNGNL